MTSTFTVSSTYTYARLQILRMQIEIAIGHIGGVSDSFKRSILAGIERRLVGDVSFYALDGEGCCRAQIDLEIDWAAHQFEIASGRATVTIDGRWHDSTAIEVDAAVDLFNRYCAENQLRSVCRVRYASGVDGAATDRLLGLVDAEPLRWAEGETVSKAYNVPELRELRVGLRLLDR